MRKFKFLSGISAMFALAAVALVTTFASCEKEDFNVIIEPVNAKANVSAIVLYMENGTTTDVTSQATVTIADYTKEGNPNLPAQTVKITATYKDVTGSVDVQIPALSAGQFANVVGTILLQSPDQTFQVVVESQDNDKTETTNAGALLVNDGDYNKNFTVNYVKKSGNKVVKEITNDNISAQEKSEIEKFFATLNETYTETPASEEVVVWAHAQMQNTVTYTLVSTSYKVYRRPDTKAEGDVELASAVVDAYQTTTFNTGKNEQIPGHGHAPIYHDHDHGHGSGNAGGGIGDGI